MATSLSRPLGATNLSSLYFPPLERQAPASPYYAKLQNPPSPLSRIRPPWPPAVQPTRPVHLRPPSVCAFADVSKPEGVSITQPSKCPFKKLLDRIGLSSNDSDAKSQCPFLNQQKMEGESGQDFVGELRAISMAYHSQEFGGALPMMEKPFSAWRPSLPAYLQFLSDQHVMHEALEKGTLLSDQHKPLRSTGLERASRLSDDRAWFAARGLELPPPDAAACAYADYLVDIAVSRPAAFTCHWYNINYAQAHGGRMLGKKCAAWFFNGHELQIFKYDDDMSKLLGSTKIILNRMAEGWNDAQRQECLEETPETFDRAWDMLNIVAA